MTAAAGVDVYATRLGDDCLLLAQRLAAWSSRAPELEEDVALTNLALDLLGQARALLTYAGSVEGRGRDEDAFAYDRDSREFLNCTLVEQPNGDFAHTMARQLLFSAFQVEQWGALRASTDATIAAIAARAAKEAAYHREHAELWLLRLGDGTEESHRRMQAGLDAMWPYASELFECDALVRDLAAAGVAADPSVLRAPWEAFVTDAIDRATLAVPSTSWAPSGGRRGLHTEALGFLLAEMQQLHRSHPGARW